MTRLFLGLAAAAFLAAPAQAQDSGFYVSGGPGVTTGHDINVTFSSGNATATSEAAPNAGLEFGGEVGARFGNFRVGLAGSYTRNSFADLQIESVSIGSGTATSSSGLGSVDLDGTISTMSGYLMGYLEVPMARRFAPFLGAGVGITRVSLNDLQARVNTGDVLGAFTTARDVSIDESDTSFGYRLTVGGRLRLTDRLDIGGAYAFSGINNLEVTTSDSDFVEVEGASHQFNLRLNYAFDLGLGRSTRRARTRPAGPVAPANIPLPTVGPTAPSGAPVFVPSGVPSTGLGPAPGNPVFPSPSAVPAPQFPATPGFTPPVVAAPTASGSAFGTAPGTVAPAPAAAFGSGPAPFPTQAAPGQSRIYNMPAGTF